MMRFRNGETLIIESERQHDPYGDLLPSGGQSRTVSGVALLPRARGAVGGELLGFRDTVIVGLTAYLPEDDPIGPYDVAVRVADGSRWQVVGEPAHWNTPHLHNGRNNCTEVALERVIG